MDPNLLKVLAVLGAVFVYESKQTTIEQNAVVVLTHLILIPNFLHGRSNLNVKCSKGLIENNRSVRNLQRRESMVRPSQERPERQLRDKTRRKTKREELNDLEANPTSREEAFEVSTADKAPFAVAVISGFRLKFDDLSMNKIYVSAGSLVHRKWVLTSASSLFKKSSVRGKTIVQAGASSIKITLEPEVENGTQVMEVINVISHPKFEQSDKEFPPKFDFALMELKEELKTTASVSVVKLSPRGWTYTTFKKCKVTAYGKTKRDEFMKVYQRKLHVLSVKTMNDSRCHNYDNPFLLMEPRPNFGLCEGDYGAGFLCEGEIKAVFSNIVSKEEVDSCFNRTKIPETDPECGLINTVTVFQDTCACIRFVNEIVNLYYDSEITDCSDRILNKAETSTLSVESGASRLHLFQLQLLVVVLVICQILSFI